MTPDPRWPSSIVMASSKLTPEGERRLGGHHRGLTRGVLAALKRISEQSGEAKVLVIARRNAELKMTRKQWSENDGNRPQDSSAPKLNGTASG